MIQEQLVDVTNFKLIDASSVRGKDGSEIDVFTETPNLNLQPTSKFRISFDLKNKDYANDFVVWTTVESLLAPMAKKFTEGSLDPAQVSSWGWDAKLKDMQIRYINFFPLDEPKHIVMGPFDLGPMIKNGDPVDQLNGLWTWALRVKIHIDSRTGKHQVFTSKVYRINPSSLRISHASNFDPGAPDGEPISRVECDPTPAH